MKSWDEIDRGILQESAGAIASLPRDKTLAAIWEVAARRHPQFVNDVMRRSFVKVEASEVLGVDGACLLIHHEERLTNDDTCCDTVGIANVIEVDGRKVPHIFLFPGADEGFVKHEKIHICQFLSPDPWPSERGEHWKFLSSASPWERVKEMLAEGKAPDDVARLLSDWVCRITWCELEAYWFTQGAAGASGYDVLKSAYRSAKPIEVLNGCAYVLMESAGYAVASGFNTILMAQAQKSIPDFCQRLELEVPWMGELLASAGQPSLYTALEAAHVEYEDLLLFGPEDWESDEAE
jgi:hypothetical protein